jgi:hypothetical protein
VRPGRKLLLLPLLIPLPVPAAAAPGWRCGVAVEVEGFPGLLWRTLDARGIAEPYYTLQVDGRGARWRFLVWGIMAPDAPPRRPRGTSFSRLRSEANAFAGGPEGITMNSAWVGRAVTGPVRAWHYGNGRLAGTQLLATRVDAAQASRRSVGIGWHLSDRAILARLARAREWLVVVRDGAGREVARETIHLPAPALVEAVYRRARPQVDAMVADYGNACTAPP